MRSVRFGNLVFTDAGWSSSVARWAHNPEVAGSNPVPATSGNGPRRRLRGPVCGLMGTLLGTSATPMMRWEQLGNVGWRSRPQEPRLRRGPERELTGSVRGTAYAGFSDDRAGWKTVGKRGDWKAAEQRA